MLTAISKLKSRSLGALLAHCPLDISHFPNTFGLVRAPPTYIVVSITLSSQKSNPFRLQKKPLQ